MTEEKIIKHKHYSNNRELQTAYEWGYKDGVTETTNELKQENNKLLDVINNQDVKIADLEQKLKEIEHNKKTVVHLSECISDIQDKQLEQAKEIIKELKGGLSMYSGNYQSIILKAEQFLKEIE